MNLCSIQVKGRSPVHIQHNIRGRRGGVYARPSSTNGRGPARFRVPEFGNSPERERPARLGLRSIAGRWRAGHLTLIASEKLNHKGSALQRLAIKWGEYSMDDCENMLKKSICSD